MAKNASNEKRKQTFYKVVKEHKYAELNRFNLDRFNNATCSLCKVKLKFRDKDTLINHYESNRHQQNLKQERLQE